jgi:hypothetical protein
MKRTLPIFTALAALGMAACSHTGLGDGVRKDVTARMATTQTPISACYEAALKKNRKLKGTIELTLTAEAKTGKFSNVRVVRNDLGDADLEKCVVDTVSKLALAEPQSSKIAVRYPLEFAPIDPPAK